MAWQWIAAIAWAAFLVGFVVGGGWATEKSYENGYADGSADTGEAVAEWARHYGVSVYDDAAPDFIYPEHIDRERGS